MLLKPINIGNDDSVRIMVNAVKCVLKQGDHTPAVITIARSPQYMPSHMLQVTECAVFEMISDLWPSLTDIYYEDGLNATRFGCTSKFSSHQVARLDYEWEYPVEDALVAEKLLYPVNIITINNSPELMIGYWIHPDTKEHHHQYTIHPYTQEDTTLTYHAHEWVITSQVDDTTVKNFTVSAVTGHTQIIRIEEGEIASARKLAGKQPVHVEQ